MLAAQAFTSITGRLTVDGWSAAVGSTILGRTWKFIEENWLIKSIPFPMLNTGTASKTAKQLKCIIQEVIRDNSVIGSNRIRIHAITSKTQAALALFRDLLTNFSVRDVALFTQLHRFWTMFSDGKGVETLHRPFEPCHNLLKSEQEGDNYSFGERIKHVYPTGSPPSPESWYLFSQALSTRRDA